MADEETEKVVGCEHYERKCAFVSPCCQNIYTCRLCHDEKENHEIDRRKVSEIQCLKCETKQEVRKRCKKCDVEFGRYFCEVCRLYDDVDKKQFHCEQCGICRVGGRENYFHCDKCDMCLSLERKDSHKCVEKASRSNCPVCMENLHTSRIPCQIPPCGHLMHRPCYTDMLETGNYACPLCGESMVDMQEYWKMLENEMNHVKMPEEYRTMKVQILCRDCHKECQALFHVVGLKCDHCGSFNTCRVAEPGNTDGKTERPPGSTDPRPVEEGGRGEDPTNQEAGTRDEGEGATEGASSIPNGASGNEEEVSVNAERDAATNTTGANSTASHSKGDGEK